MKRSLLQYDESIINHQVARCVWHTSFDNQKTAYHLQNYLSDWSNSELIELLNKAFDQYCPEGYTWRIDKLELDLGNILFDDINVELPKRVKSALNEQLSRLLYQADWTNTTTNNQIINPHYSLLDVIEQFLQTGTVPWWYDGKQTNQALLLQHITETPERIAALLRSVGQADTVRRRIAWQYDTVAIKKIVGVLEPQHHDYIINYTENLQAVQVKTQKPTSNRTLFAQQTWFWVLTHLLVERGSFFNTVTFVESTLKQLAQTYQLDFALLLQQLVNAVQNTELHKPQFIQALLLIQEKNNDNSETAPYSSSEVLAYFLETGMMPHWYEGKQRPESLLWQTLHDLPEQISAVLQTLGQDETVRQRLVWQFSEKTLKKMVQVLEPEHYVYIIKYTDDLEQLAHSSFNEFSRHRWFWILTHLLVERGSLFNTIAFVESTLKQMARTYQLDFVELINQLVSVAQQLDDKGNKKPEFIQALLAVQKKTPIIVKDDWQVFEACLQGQELSRLNELFALLSRKDAVRMTAILKTQQTIKVQQRLLNQLGKNEWQLLIKLIAPQEHLFIFALLKQLQALNISEKQVWQIMLENLFSGLNRKRLVENTLKRISRIQGVSYTSLLNVLMMTPVITQTEHLVLFNVIKELIPTNHPIDEVYKQALSLYFNQGQLPKALGQHYLTTPEQLFVILLYRYSAQWRLLIEESKPSPKQILELIQPADFSELLITLNAELGSFAYDVLKQLLTTVPTMDIYELHALILRLVMEQQEREVFLSLLYSELTKRYGVVIQQTIKPVLNPAPFWKTAKQLKLQPYTQTFKLAEQYLIHGGFPAWLPVNRLNLSEVLNVLIETHPQDLQQLIKQYQQRPDVLFRLQTVLSFDSLLEAVRLTTHGLHNTLKLVFEFYQTIAKLRFNRVSVQSLQAILWQQVLQAWLSGNWQSLNTEQLLLNFSAVLIQRYSLSLEQVASEFKQHAPRFELKLPVSNKPVVSVFKLPEKQSVPIQINNAGLVILQGFIVPYFNRLGLIKDRVFCDETAQRKAVHALQYLVTGQTETEEQHLVLNKLLCDIAPNTPIELGIELSDEDKATGDSLLEAVINYWTAIGSCSINGFRGNWLIRNGLLSFEEQCWELRVEKRAYDLLLQHAPFSYSMIKLPWMNAPLTVNWTI